MELTPEELLKRKEEYFAKKERQDVLASQIAKMFDGYELQEAEYILSLAKSKVNGMAVISVCN